MKKKPFTVFGGVKKESAPRRLRRQRRNQASDSALELRKRLRLRPCAAAAAKKSACLEALVQGSRKRRVRRLHRRRRRLQLPRNPDSVDSVLGLRKRLRLRPCRPGCQEVCVWRLWYRVQESDEYADSTAAAAASSCQEIRIQWIRYWV